MPYRLALDQEALHAIHDVRTWAYALVDTILGNFRVQPDWSATTLRRIGRLSNDELHKIRDVAEGRRGYDSLESQESYELALDLVPHVTTRQALDFFAEMRRRKQASGG